MKPIVPARLAFRDGVPCSAEYGDVYFSREGGLEEVRHVFLAGNDLPGRWTKARTFTIGETGFGTGLNFLVTLAEWQRQAPAQARLHYVSVEKHPFTANDLRKALTSFPALAEVREALLAGWPPLVEGLHRRELFDGRVTLTLLFGDARDMLAGLEAKIDAWYLDGFAPARNPGMWRTELFREIARLSRPGATFATFTAAGDVRRGLAEAGLVVHKRPGFGRKREMLAGRIPSPPETQSTQPWFDPPEAIDAERRAIVVGAGLAGATTAFALADRGWQVTVLEAGAAIAGGASGNPTGVLMPRLNADMDPGARFHLGASLNSAAWLETLALRDLETTFHATGVLQLDTQRRHVGRIHSALPPTVVQALTPADTEERAGLPLNGAALCHVRGGWLAPAALCRRLLDHPRIEVRTGLAVQRLERREDRWHLGTLSGSLRAPIVVLANGAAAQSLAPELHWNLQSVRGQISYLQAPRSAWPRLPVVGDGYVTPTGEDFLVIGATFDKTCPDPQLRDVDHQANRERLRRSLPTLVEHPLHGGRVGFRTTTPDRLPLIGAVPDPAFYCVAYGGLRHGPRRGPWPRGHSLPGLFISSGHGARGLSTCPVAALHLAALLEHEPLPLLQNQQHVVHPGRFLIRQLKRGRI